MLRLVCETLDGLDAAVLRDRLLDLPASSQWRSTCTPARLTCTWIGSGPRRRTWWRWLASGSGCQSAPQLHRAAEPGQSLSAATLIFVVQ